MSKSEAIISMLDSLALAINHDSRGLADSQTLHICTLCSGSATTFTDALCRKEYGISGMCQVCQDNTFGPSTVDPNDTIQICFGDYTEEEIRAAYDEYDADQRASR